MTRAHLFLGLVVATLLAGTASQAAEKINIGLVRSPASAPFYIAKEKDFFATEDIEVNLVHLNAWQTIAAAVASGDVRFGMMAVSAEIYGMAAKGAVKMIAGGAEEHPGYRGLALVANRSAYEQGLRSPADLQGKRIAITDLGSASHSQLARLARKHGLRPQDVQFVALQTVASEIAALKAGDVDAAPLPAAYAKELEDSGAATVIAWMGDELSTQVAGLFAPADARRQGLTRRFVRAYVKAVRYYTQAFQRRDQDGKPVRGDNYEEALRIIAQHTGEPTARLATTLPYLDPEGTIAGDDLAEQIEIYKALRLLDARVDANTVIDGSFVPVRMKK